MAKIEMEKELVEKHSQEEIISYLYTIMLRIRNNFSNSAKNGNNFFIWASVGDIAEVTEILKQLELKRQERESLSQDIQI